MASLPSNPSVKRFVQCSKNKTAKETLVSNILIKRATSVESTRLLLYHVGATDVIVS